MVDFVEKDRYTYEDLLEIIRLLRSPDGCPWDKIQTHASIRRGLLEEAYEAAEAIDNDDPVSLCEELGDVLMQVVFHASLSGDAGQFTMDDVTDGVVKKLLYRHPHVFGHEQAQTSGEVLVRWDELKRREKGQRSTSDAMDSVARSLPSLWRSEKILEKAAKAGFDRSDSSGALDKLCEETDELRRAVAAGSEDAIAEKIGDVLFAAAGIAQRCGVDPEAAVHAACEKFLGRFRRVEDELTQENRPMDAASSEELAALWNRAKQS
jgi:tetrapyrrole methylase family protein/MazG family protein